MDHFKNNRADGTHFNITEPVLDVAAVSVSGSPAHWILGTNSRAIGKAVGSAVVKCRYYIM